MSTVLKSLKVSLNHCKECLFSEKHFHNFVNVVNNLYLGVEFVLIFEFFFIIGR